jgi:hypothetical protein
MEGNYCDGLEGEWGGGMKKIRVVGCLGLPLEMLLTCQFYFESSSLSFVIEEFGYVSFPPLQLKIAYTVN